MLHLPVATQIEIKENLGEENLEPFANGIEHFNNGQFFECHEVLELIWRDNKVKSDVRDLLQGIIQIAVAYHHLNADNLIGASKLFKKGLRRLSKYEPRTFGLDLRKFRDDVALQADYPVTTQGMKQIETPKPQLSFL